MASQDNPVPVCPKCGQENSSATKFCRRCGTSLLVASGPPPATPIAAPPAPAASPTPGSLQASLARIGLRPTCGQLASFAAAVVFGLALARLLPLVFPFFYPILSFVFIDLLHSTPDAFNTMAMTSLTCLGSFGLAFLTSLILGRRRRSRA